MIHECERFAKLDLSNLGQRLLALDPDSVA